MKRTSLLAAAVAAAFCLSAPVASAQDRALDPQAGNLDPKTQGPNLRVSELMGMNIKNSQGEDVGEVEDIVLNVQTGKVNYAAVSYGGFLGIGDDLFAVPFEAFKVGKVRGDDEYVLVLDVTKEQLEGAKGFDKDNWPNFADQEFARELDMRYNVKREPETRERRVRDRDLDVDVDTGRDGTDVKVKRESDNN